jgi:hypothetical protein
VAITNVDSLIANLIPTPTPIGKISAGAPTAGLPYTPWYLAGTTAAGGAPSGGHNGAVFSGTVTGQIPIPAASSGETTRLARLSLVSGGNVGMVWVVDRMWGNVPTVTTTTAQTITSPTWPARDVSGSTTGAGVYLALECSSTTGNSGAITNTTVSYTNSAGTSGRSATLPSFPATAASGTWAPLTLAAGDVGVQSVQSITLGTSYVSGAIHLVAYRWVADLAIPTASVGSSADFAQLGLPTIWDSSVLQLVYWPTGGALGALTGSASYAQG